MIELKDFKGKTFLLNSQLIETVESIPETKITLTTGKYILVKEDLNDIIDKVIEFNRKVYGADREIKVVKQDLLDD